MNMVGKALLFYMKYAAEMEQLYQGAGEDKNLVLEGADIKDREQIEKMARVVGDAASRDADEILDACKEPIEVNLGRCGKFRLINSPERYWQRKWNLFSRNNSQRLIEVGIWIEPKASALLPWIWCKTSRRARNEIIEILNCKADQSNAQHSDWGGTVILDNIKFDVLDISLETLIQRAVAAFAFSASQVDAIAAIGLSDRQNCKPAGGH